MVFFFCLIVYPQCRTGRQILENVNGVLQLYLGVASMSVWQTDLQDVIGELLVFHGLVSVSAYWKLLKDEINVLLAFHLTSLFEFIWCQLFSCLVMIFFF